MVVREIMTPDPVCCTPNTKLQSVARMMVENDCGAIPVVESKTVLRPVGMITDRDITCETVAEGKNPLELSAADCMTKPAVVVSADADIEECCQLMEEHQIRRLPVVDDGGRCCGIVAIADLASRAPGGKTEEVVQAVSEPNHEAARAPSPRAGAAKGASGMSGSQRPAGRAARDLPRRSRPEPALDRPRSSARTAPHREVEATPSKRRARE